MNRLFHVAILLFFITVALPGPLSSTISAQRFYRAELIGPWGGEVYQVVIDPSNAKHLFAANGSLFQSFNQGSSWSNIPVQGNNIRNITIDPKYPSILYISSDFTGIFVSMDAGKTWILKALPNQSRLIRKLEINKKDSALYMGTDKGLFKSSDQGTFWTELTVSFGNQKYVSDFEFAPLNPSIIYLSIAGRKFFISMDAGATWQERSVGIQELMIEDIATDPNQESIIYATCTKGIYKTINQGLSWKFFPLSPALFPPAFSTLVNPKNSHILYTTTNDGIYTSYDAGISWSKTNQGIEKIPIHSLCISPGDSMLYASTRYGLFRTGDPKTGWVMANQGLSSQNISKIFQDPFDRNFIYAFIQGFYLCRYDLAKQTWVFLPTTYSIADVVNDPNTRNVLWAVASNRDCVIRSTDSGKSWTETSKGMFASKPLSSLQIDPKNSGIIFVGTANEKMSGGDGLYKSMDAGKHWARVGKTLNNLGTSSILINKTDTRKIVLLAGNGMGPADVYRSLDSGITWKLVKKSGTTPIVKILLSPTGKDEIFCLTRNDGVYRSSDWGENVTKIIAFEGRIIDFTIDPKTSTFYMVTEKSGFLKSEDGGKNWSPVFAGILPQSIFCTLLDTHHENTLLCGSDKGVVRITNIDLHLTISGSVGGNLSPQGNLTIIPGNNQEITIFPDSGYVIEKVLLDQKMIPFESIKGCTISIDILSADHSLYVSFIKEIPTASQYLTLQIGQGNLLLNGIHSTIDSNPDVVPVVLNNRTLLPIRALIEILGGTVEWDESSRTATIKYQERQVSLMIGQSTALVDGHPVIIDPSNPSVVPMILINRTFLPLRFIAEAIGFTVYWDERYQVVTLVGK